MVSDRRPEFSSVDRYSTPLHGLRPVVNCRTQSGLLPYLASGCIRENMAPSALVRDGLEGCTVIIAVHRHPVDTGVGFNITLLLTPAFRHAKPAQQQT